MKSDYSSKGREHVTETPDVSHIRNVDVTHEMSDVHIRGILTFIAGLTVMTIVVYLLMWGMFRVFYAQEDKKDSQTPPSPMAMSGKERLPPEPRLQSAPGFGEALEKESGKKESQQMDGTPRDPLWEINVLREHWESTLKSGAKDQSGKVIILPIDEAKQELLKQGLPTRTNGPATADTDDLPTAASSGRMAASGKQ